MQKITTKGLAAKLNIEYPAAQGLMKFLEAKGLARDTGDAIKMEGAKGKGSAVWELPDIILIDLLIPEVKGSNPEADYQKLVQEHGGEDKLVAAAQALGVDL